VWMAQNEETIRGTEGGPIAPQKWGASTQRGKQISLHILDSSDAKDGGWLTLTGSMETKLGEVRQFAGAAVESHRNSDGLLEVRLPEETDVVDIILVGSLEK
jgi:alpha-L-fucosidase